MIRCMLFHEKEAIAIINNIVLSKKIKLYL